MGGIDTDGIDRTVMTLHLSNWHKGIHVPEFQNAPSAATEQNRVARHHSQGTDPILVCIWNLLREKKRNQQLKGNLPNLTSSHQNKSQ
jgi:hemolysin-activating ACP:hemolysin acyltransferase